VNSSERRWLWLIAGAAVLVRVAAAVYLGNDVVEMPGIADQRSYHTLAGRVLEGHGFSFATGWWPATPAEEPTAHWSYLYVLFLAAVYGSLGYLPLAARLIQAVLVGVLQPIITYRITRTLFGGRVALISAALVAGYAYFVYYAGALMTEAFSIVAMLWSLDAALRIVTTDERSTGGRRAWLELGLALATAVLLRQTVLFVAPVILGWATWRSAVAQKASPGIRAALSPLVGATLAIVVMGAAILPWTFRNQRAFNQFVLLNTNAGFAFYWGNHPVHGTEFVPILPDGEYGRLIPDDLRGLNEAEMEQALLARGLAFVTSDPIRFLRLSLSRVKEYVRFWPSSESGLISSSARLLSFGACLPFFLLGLLLAGSQPGVGRPASAASGVWLLIAVAGSYSLLHVLSWTLVRYRLPVDAMLMPFAALAIAGVHDRLRFALRRYH
jgi:hypothetical protein